MNPAPTQAPNTSKDWLSELECVVLEPRPGVSPSSAPAVRIFLGTETAQFRPERIFIWSIEQVRDPSRRYEIYLMRAIEGFKSGLWTTGFTNFRFAIPTFCKAQGRAIYNDVDQIYLTDPAELFDLSLGQHGFRAISPRESSVMVMDCARMAAVWNVDAARRVRKRPLLARARHLYGPLDPHWNARDNEYVPGRTKVFHFTTLHTQPWRPLPDRFVYQAHPFGEVWFALERSADRAGFVPFTRECPSRHYRNAVRGQKAGLNPPLPTEHSETVQALIRRTQSTRLLEYGAGITEQFTTSHDRSVTQIQAYSPQDELFADLPDGKYDAVVCTTGLEQVPEEDIAWVLDELFSKAERFVYAAVDSEQSNMGAGWWQAQFDAAARRQPDVYWHLAVRRPQEIFKKQNTEWHVGGRLTGPEPPVVWVLLDEDRDNAERALALARALGWDFESKRLHYSSASLLHNRLLGASLRGLEQSRCDPLQAPWPDLVIAAGRRSAPIAQWIRDASRGLARLVQIGREGADYARLFDIAITPSYAHLFPHPNRIEVTAPIRQAPTDRMQAAAQQWRPRLETGAKPLLALFVSGGSDQFRFDVEVAHRLGKDVTKRAEQLGASLWIIAASHTGAAQVRALRESAPGAELTVRSSVTVEDDPCYAGLALAQTIVVTGDSEDMLAEACSTGKTVLIYSLPVRARFRVLAALRNMISRRAEARPANDRGTARPQLGLERWCARLIETGWVRPTFDLRSFHRVLLERGLACRFDSEQSIEPSGRLFEPMKVPIARVQAWFNVVQTATLSETGPGARRSA